MSLKEMDLRKFTLIQLGIAVIIALIVQFLVPLSWQPFNAVVGNVFGVKNGTGVLIASLDIWFFAFSVIWFIFRENPYLNSLLMYSLIPLGVIIGLEFAFYYLFWDYIHLLPFIIGTYILLKKRNTLRRKYILLFTFILTGWVLLAYFLGLAYSAIPILMLALGVPIFIAVMIQVSYWTTHIKHPKKRILRRILKGFIAVLWIFGVFLGSVLLFWYLRPNTINVNEKIVIDSWVAVTGRHNSNTDMIAWNGTIYLIHDQRPFHLGSTEAKLIIWNSTDAYTWTKVIEFQVPGNDIRDPKFAIIDNRLFLYALKNLGVMATPYQTVYTYTEDGINWQPFQDIAQMGWLFWRPKTNDNITWYVPAYWHKHGQSILLNSTDGINWNIIAPIYIGEGNDETAIEFLPDGRMICTARLEGKEDTIFGSSNASTLIATSSYPFDNWSSYIKSRVTRLDGPVLFSYENRTFAVGRNQVGPRTYFTELGGVFSRKRTSIFLVNETTGLTHLTDLPSAGDTSYAGVVRIDEELYVSYYTSDITKDYPWILGMISDSDIRIAKMNLTALIELVELIT
ncbi:MAG TPA: hypothetical protein VMV49_14670 [Candidatus Deferrimicrobium sp.]|nr:hypothetical protein [Candidatus Deferrimicrobium sp.]